MNNSFTPIKQKLTKSSLRSLGISFAIIGILVYYALTSLTGKFLELNEKNSGKFENDIKVFSEKNSTRIKEIFFDALKSKGDKLIQKDSSSLYSAFTDNAFIQVRDFIKSNFKNDVEIVKASFFVQEDGVIKAWQYVDRKYPNGLELPILYNKKTQAWESTYIDDKKVSSKISISDPTALEVANANGPVIKQIEIEENGEKKLFFDCYIPVVKEQDPAEIQDMRADGSPIAYLRYVLSLEKMNEALKVEKKNLEEYLAKLQQESSATKIESQAIGRKKLISSIFLMLFCLAGVSVGVYFVTNKFATRLSQPIGKLTEFAKKMEQGEYDQTADVTTDDEIGILANTFNKMGAAILKRDRDLAEFNRSLEQLVQDRTKQLHEEIKKVKALLDNMAQAVFSVDEKGLVVAPVSSFTEKLLGRDIVGKTIFQTIFSTLDNKSEQFANLRTAMSVVYGETDLQWMLMEDNLPSKVYLNKDNKVLALKIKYSPLWTDDGNLSRIMFMVDDVTELERLEREIAIKEKESKRRMEILRELSNVDVEDLKGFFKNAFFLLDRTMDLIPELQDDLTVIDEVFRNLHTLKGNSRVFDLSEVSTITHNVETMVAELKKNKNAKVDQEFITALKNEVSKVYVALKEYSEYAERILKIENEYKGKLDFMLYKQTGNFLNRFNEFKNGNKELKHELSSLIFDIRFVVEKYGDLDLLKTVDAIGSSLKTDNYDIPDKIVKLSEIVASNYTKSHVFKAHTNDMSTSVLLILPIAKASHKFLKDKKCTPEVVSFLESAWSHCNANGFIYLQNVLEALINDDRIDQADYFKKIWEYLVISIKFETTYRLPKDKLVGFCEMLTAYFSDKLKYSLFLEQLKEYKCLFASLLFGLERHDFGGEAFLGIFNSYISPVNALQFVDILLDKDVVDEVYFDLKDSLKANPNNLELYISQISGSKPRITSLILKNVKGNDRFIFQIDLLQMMMSYFITESDLKQMNANVIEVLGGNFNRLKDFIETRPESEKNLPMYGELRVLTRKLLDVPLKPLFFKYYNLIKDISKKIGKKAKMKVIGPDITVDRDKSYLLQDALTHIVRNALDHALEDPDTRMKNNKNAIGMITFTLEELDKGFNLVIADDGIGIDVDRVVQKALAKNIYTQEELNKMSNEQKLDVIFVPGFSTKDTATDLSGRGVGMDVVKNNIKSMGGTIKVDTKVGMGTKFTLSFQNG